MSAGVTIDRMVFLLRDLLLSMNRVEKVMAKFANLNTTDLTCLTIISESPSPVTAKMLSAHLGLTTGATTALIDRLEIGGYVMRQPHPTDRRAVIVRLSDRAGGYVVATLRDRFRESATKAWSEFTSAELEIVQRFISATIERSEVELMKAAENHKDVAELD